MATKQRLLDPTTWRDFPLNESGLKTFSNERGTPVQHAREVDKKEQSVEAKERQEKVSLSQTNAVGTASPSKGRHGEKKPWSEGRE